MAPRYYNKDTGEVVVPSKVIFRNMFMHDDSNVFSQDLSRETVDDYELDENGQPVKVGETNVYNKIQEYKDQCDTYKILDRYNCPEDFLLDHDPCKGFSGDFTNIPTNMLDAMNDMDEAISKWNSLPKDFRSMFGDSFSIFAKTTPEDMDAKLNLYAQSKQPKVESKGDE